MNKMGFLGLLFLLVGCGSSGMSDVKVQSDYNVTYDFTSVRRFAFKPETGVKLTADPEKAEYVNARIRRAVVENLRKKGLEESTNPDLWIVYDVALKDNERTSHFLLDIRDAGSENPQYKTTNTPYREGTLVIAFINTKTTKAVWRGSLQAEVDKVSTGKEQDQRIHKAVKELLGAFPPH